MTEMVEAPHRHCAMCDRPRDPLVREQDTYCDDCAAPLCSTHRHSHPCGKMEIWAEYKAWSTAHSEVAEYGPGLELMTLRCIWLHVEFQPGARVPSKGAWDLKIEAFAEELAGPHATPAAKARTVAQMLRWPPMRAKSVVVTVTGAGGQVRLRDPRPEEVRKL